MWLQLFFIMETDYMVQSKFGGDGKARAGKNSFPPTLFLFARPNKNYQNSASEFSRKKVRIWYNIGSQIVCSAFVASALRASVSALRALRADFERICHAPRGSKNNFRSRKIRFAVARQQNSANGGRAKR